MEDKKSKKVKEPKPKNVIDRKTKIVRRTNIGGQAVLEGVMMKGARSIATAVRTPDGEAYAAKMVKEGYSKTESGLVYKVLAEGSGENFTADQQIDLKYEGKLIDGKVFDSTNGDETRALSPNGVVPGFREALLMMKPGAKMIVVIPGDLAYGADGRGGMIGPNATLVFTIETIGVHEVKK